VLTDADHELLERRSYMRLATLMPDGSPQVTVLWFRLAGDALHVICPQSAQKVKNVDRDPRVSAVIEDPDTPHRFIELRGRCEALRDDPGARREMVPIAHRYIGERAEEFAAGLSEAPRVILLITPERVIRHGVD
jgi:PPOX class probable F420-dependent enzyme